MLAALSLWPLALRALPKKNPCPLWQLLGHPCGPTSYSAAYSRCAFLRFGASTLAVSMFCFARPDLYAFVKGDNTTDRRPPKGRYGRSRIQPLPNSQHGCSWGRRQQIAKPALTVTLTQRLRVYSTAGSVCIWLWLGMRIPRMW